MRESMTAALTPSSAAIIAVNTPLPQHNGAALVQPYDVEQVLANIDPHNSDRREPLRRFCEL
jgi:hypothetical protein